MRRLTFKRADGDARASAGNAFDAVKVFSATMSNDRGQLGETVSAWIARQPTIQITDLVVRQSSDENYHCISISVFYVQRRP